MDINQIIPQKPPFRFLDDIIEHSENKIITSVHFSEELDFFKGHFPGNPIVPGVILSESCFQSGAALISLNNPLKNDNLAVVSRIQSAKFKKMVGPNETVHVETTITEQIENAAYFKSIVKNSEKKKVLIIEFACTLVQGENQ